MGFHKFPKDRQKIAGFIVFHDITGKVLLLKKSSGKWDLPKGHVEDEETFLEGALRECYEETGLHHKENLNAYPYHYVSIPSKKWLRFYLGFTDDEIDLSDEHVSHLWVYPEDADQYFGSNNHFTHAIQMLSIPARQYGNY